MLGTLMLAILEGAYVATKIDERKQAKKEAEEKAAKDALLDKKVKCFCYAVAMHISYNEVVEQIRSGKLSFEDIDKVIK